VHPIDTFVVPNATETSESYPGSPVRADSDPVSSTTESPQLLPSETTYIPNITKLVVKTSSAHVARGGFYAVYRGRHEVEGDVAMRLPLESMTQAAPELQRRFWLEVQIWFDLRHRNISRLLGVYRDDQGDYMVSPWMENGNVADCLSRDHPFDLLKVLSGIADALAYLHGKGYVHGDLKLENVLLSNDGEAILTDFGLTRQLKTLATSSSTTMSNAGNFRWFAPEIAQGAPKSSRGDVYAFGMMIAEVLTRRPPFWRIVFQGALILAIVTGQRPSERDIIRGIAPACCTELWKLAKDCWSQDEDQRPSMIEVVHRLEVMR